MHRTLPALAAALGLVGASAAQAGDVVVHAGALFDGVSPTLRRQVSLLIHDDRIVAVGRYERLPETDEAEVAFVVTDDYQHRGIGSRLLVHLAEAARAHGIARFHAQTLSENRDMLGVFLSSGYPVTTTSEAGTVTVRFPIDPAGVTG